MTASPGGSFATIPASHVLGRKLDSIPFAGYHVVLIVVLGFVGVAIRKNNALPAEDDLEQNAAPPEERARLRSPLTKGPEEFREVRVDRLKAK